MATEMGEYLVGAYLRLIAECDLISYNVRSPENGLAGLAEIDVIGLNLTNHTAYLCEVATHLDGLLYGSGYEDSARKVREKYERLKSYGEAYLHEFTPVKYMFWCPRIPRGKLTDLLKSVENEGLEMVVNEDYKRYVNDLRGMARKSTRDIGNPFFRALQILEHLHD